jgi:periplasmic divalent cation tolerance protein
MSEPIVVFVTCGEEDEAVTIARTLVEERLAACVSIVPPVRSIYRWEGKIWDEEEFLLIIKTEKERFQDLQEKVKSLHSYSVPEIIGLPSVEGSPDYLKWLLEMTQ